ncbi:hypothetical protein KKHLCK_12400 [Candidatus Electrothrix laxa]
MKEGEYKTGFSGCYTAHRDKMRFLAPALKERVLFDSPFIHLNFSLAVPPYQESPGDQALCLLQY